MFNKTKVRTVSSSHFAKYSITNLNFFSAAALLLLILVAISSTPASAQSVSSSLGWSQLSNTQLKSVCPPNGSGGGANAGYPFASQCGNVIGAWSGGIADTKRNRMIIWGGGHTDYYGNELYSLNLSNLSLTRLNNPSPINAPVQNPSCASVLSDGAPNSRHSYS